MAGDPHKKLYQKKISLLEKEADCSREEFIERVQEDYEIFHQRWILDTTKRQAQLFSMMSINGHAQNGHVAFSDVDSRGEFQLGIIAPSSTLEDITRALGESPAAVKKEHDCAIEDIRQFLHDLISGKEITQYVSQRTGKVLGGQLALEGRTISNPLNVVKGFVLAGGYMDDWISRSYTNVLLRQEGKMQLGGGICVPLSYFKLLSGKRNPDFHPLHELTRREHTYEDFEKFVEKGTIFFSDQFSDPDISSSYVRIGRGPGVSDDIAIIMGGLLYNSIDVAIGVFLADYIDTMDKFTTTIRFGGYDSFIAKELESQLPENFVTREEATRFIYSCAMSTNGTMVPRENFMRLSTRGIPDSSQRYLSQKGHGQSPIRKYLEFIESREPTKKYQVRLLEKMKTLEERDFSVDPELVDSKGFPLE